MLKKNPDVLAGNKFITSGREMHSLRPGDNKKWTDIGLIESIELSREEDKRTLTGNRRGLTATYKELVDRSTLTAVVQTSSTGDLAVRELFQGTRAIVIDAVADAFAGTTALALGDVVIATGRLYEVVAAGTTGASAPVWPAQTNAEVVSGTVTFRDIGTVGESAIYAYPDGSNITQCATIIVQSTQDSEGDAGRSTIRIFPNANMQGTGNPTIQDFDGYELTMTATKNLSFVPPAELGSFGTKKPDGYVYDVPNHRLDAVLDTLADALADYVGV